MLVLRCTLLRATFDGALPDDPRVAEWPPSWMRLFSALVSVAEVGRDDALLETLEGCDPPEIYASDTLRPGNRSAFVPTNDVGPTTHTTLPARTNSERGWARAVPKSREVWYRWLDLQMELGDRARLAELCRRVPYFGRSTSPALVEMVDEEPATGQRLVPIIAGSNPGAFSFATTIRCPFPGSLDALRTAYRAKYLEGGTGDPWEIGVGVDYGIVRPVEAEQEMVEGPYSTLVVLRLEGLRLDGRHTARLTHAFRQAMLSRAQRQIPTLHGHHEGDVVQCAVLGLPFVDAERADGHILGVGVAIPNLPAEDLAVVAGALPQPGEVIEVTAGPLGVLRFARVNPLDAVRLPRGLQPTRWIGPSRSWITSLPMVFDRFLKRGADIEAEVRRAVVNSRLPEPQAVWISRRPLLRGAPDLAPADTLRRPIDTAVKPYRHVALRFERSVRGPVVVGSMRHYGLGLCAPVAED